MFVLMTSIRSYTWFSLLLRSICVSACAPLWLHLDCIHIWYDFAISIHIHKHVFDQYDSVHATYAYMWTWLLVLSMSVWLYFNIQTYIRLYAVLSSLFMQVNPLIALVLSSCISFYTMIPAYTWFVSIKGFIPINICS